VLVAGFPAGSFQTNCYVVAPAAGEACVVVDPGQDAVEPLEALLAEHRLTPVAVLLTHGHFDHTFSVAPVCDGHDVAAWIHPDDRALLADPMKGLSTEAAAFFGGRLTLREPAEVRPSPTGPPWTWPG
jgi:glyoxylase-like metal-dependent hydrolase (beta-lactamase superfamily II)